MARLTAQQVDSLLQPIAGARVQKTRNSQGRTASNVEAYDIRRRLINIFGFAGWSGEVLDMRLIGEAETMVGKKDNDPGKPGVTVAYLCTYRLTVYGLDGQTLATYTESATGDGTMGVASRWDAHDFAVKTAESQALKRCAINLGDQFGLSLYNDGSLAPLVKYVLGDDPAAWRDGAIFRPEQAQHDGNAGDVPTTDHVTDQLAPEDPADSEAGDAPPSPPASDPPDEPTEVDGQQTLDDVPADELPPEDRLSAEVDQIVADRQGGVLSPAEAKRALRNVLLEAGRLQVMGAVVGDRTLEAKIAHANGLVK